MGESITPTNRSDRRAQDSGARVWTRRLGLGPGLLIQALVLAALASGCGSSGRTPARPAPSAAAPSAEVASPAVIGSLELREDGDVAFLEIVADRALVWTNYRDSLGNLVVELPNSVPAADVSDLMTPEGLVASVEIERLDDADRPLTRLVVRTREDSEHSLVTEGTTLSLQLLPVGYEEPVTLAYEPLEEDEEAVAETALPPTAQQTFGTPEAPLRGPAVIGVGATRLQTVDVLNAGDTTVVQVGGDGEFTYSTFRLENPERFVIDLEGVVNTSGLPTIEVGTELVDQVRVGQFKPSPDAVSRVVFDLNQPVLPRIERTADGLTVSFGAAGPVVAEESPLPEEAGVEIAEVPEETVLEETVAEDVVDVAEIAESPAPVPEPTFEEETAFEEEAAVEEEATEVASAQPQAEMPPPAPEVASPVAGEPVVEQLPEPTRTAALPPPAPQPAAPFRPPETTVSRPVGETGGRRAL